MMRFEYTATMEDGSTLDVVADQRDVAAFEVSPNGCSFLEATSKPFTYARYMAWHAARRGKLTTLTWEDWDAQCVQVDSRDEKDDLEASDPGQPVASAGI